VDDFEYYGDNENRIFDVWTDFAINNTGMTVGHFDPPYADRNIVHSGSQSMYMHYDNDGTINEGTSLVKVGTLLYSETKREWEDVQNWTRFSADSLTLWFRGLPASVGSFTAGPTITMTAGGADISGTSDQFHYAYKQIHDNGSITARIVSISNTDPWAKAGVMIRETLSADSIHAMLAVTPGNGIVFQRRYYTGAASELVAIKAAIAAPQWLRLTRDEYTFTAEFSANGTNWTKLSSVDISMPADVYIGLCLTSNNLNATCTAEFTDVTTAEGQWQSQDIGIKSNIPEQLYVVLQDGTNNFAIVKHPDPASSAISDWTEWNIPLTDFTGVNTPLRINLQAVRNLAIGVGDRANKLPGGSGDLYIDDIRLYRP
jgi:regulation of enolase protein 1 (concanavalin A-like superfamily)